MLRDVELAVLSEAAARGAPLVLSLPAEEGLRHCKSRFLQMGKDGIWIESVAAEKTLLGRLTATAAAVGVTFKFGPVKFLFSAPLLSASERFRLHAQGATVPALRVQLPQELKTIQRRAAYRTPARREDLSVAVWRMAPDAELRAKPLTSERLQVEALDVSLGGLGLLLRPMGGRPAMVIPGQRLRTELSSAAGTILLEGRLRGGRPAGETGAVLAGIQWILPQDHFEAAQLTGHLEKLVNRLQRQELRRGKFSALRAG
jgi:c-di-GMP-binding flagellar brake protein YcgR